MDRQTLVDITRRHFFGQCGVGVGKIALASLLTDALAGGARAGEAADGPLAPKPPHYEPKAKRVIHLFMNGGPFQGDFFDPKPAINEFAGQRPAEVQLRTENPTGDEAVHFTVIGGDDPEFAGGSYVIVQKYLHDMKGWNALPVEAQERIIGRTKLSDVELDDGVKPSWSHSALTTLEEDGKEIKILRDNMPFGRPGSAEFGTYFIGYARSPRPIEQMLENMFVGRPPGNYDRLLDFSNAVTGGLFFVPSVPMLEALAEREAPLAEAGPESIRTLIDTPSTSTPVVDVTVSSLISPSPAPADGSLQIGSLKGVSQA